VMASDLLDDEYTYENLVAVPGVSDAQARAIADAAARARGAARTGVRVS
jgi:ketol-acid reductoisomerase